MERIRLAVFHLVLVLFLGIVVPAAVVLTLIALVKEFIADRRPAAATL